MLKIVLVKAALTLSVFCGALFCSFAFAESCQLDNVYLQAMPEGKVSVTNTDGEVLHLFVKTASTDRTRAAGFQRVCASTIEAKPILFLFDRAFIPQFHMRNVVAPIDIAFIDQQGQIESIQSMLPYVIGSVIRPLYSPRREVVAALEVHQGFYEKHKLEVGARVEWELLETEP